MAQPLPSLEIVLDLNQGERALLVSHFDALDTKAGVVLGFAGVLVALSSGTGSWVAVASVFSAVAAAFLAVAAFWPRRVPTLLPSVLGEYVGAESAFTRLRVIDTLELMINEASSVVSRKGRLLKFAMASLAFAALMFATEQIVT
jgi:hypothetical protein